MSNISSSHLSRREAQIMNILFADGEATARDIWKRIPHPPSYSSVRKILSILEEKHHISHRKEGKTYYYKPLQAKKQVVKSLFRNLIDTYFQGSIEQAVTGLISSKGRVTDQKKLQELEEFIKQWNQQK